MQYALIILGTTYTILIKMLIIIYPPQHWPIDFFQDFRWQSVAFRISIVLSMAYGLIVYLTLQHLSVSIQLLVSEQYEEGEKKKHVTEIFGYVVLGIVLMSIIGS